MIMRHLPAWSCHPQDPTPPSLRCLPARTAPGTPAPSLSGALAGCRGRLPRHHGSALRLLVSSWHLGEDKHSFYLRSRHYRHVHQEESETASNADYLSSHDRPASGERAPPPPGGAALLG